MGQISPKQNQLLQRMEGKDADLLSSVQAVTRFFTSSTLGSAVDEALQHQLTLKAFEEMLDGLVLEFEKRTISVPIEHLPPRSLELVLIRMFGDVLPEGPMRVTTPKGFLFLHDSLQQIASDHGLLKKSVILRRQVLNQTTSVSEDEEECPICMDRPIDTVLSCSHGICKVCEIEWLIGEGRGTCPLCRAKEKVGDDWVLNGKDIFLSLDRAEVHDRIRKRILSIYAFLVSLPTWSECVDVLRIKLSAHEGEVEEEIYDGNGNWLRSELSFLKEEKTHDTIWGRCPRCTCVLRIPPSSTGSTRLNCPGCRSLWPVEKLDSF